MIGHLKQAISQVYAERSSWRCNVVVTQTYACPWCPKLLEAQNGTLLLSPTLDEFPDLFIARSHDLSLSFFGLKLYPMWSQEHVILLRGLVVAFPGQYADLGLLLDKDSELDFFNNVAHLQLHRRQRALQRLTKVPLPLPSALCPLPSALCPLPSALSAFSSIFQVPCVNAAG